MTAYIVVHDGKFHADDVLACATVRQVHLNEGHDVEIVRTRDASITAGGMDRIVIDVGGVHDVARNMFDHHQAGAPRREDGTPYSAFGLVWQNFGRMLVSDLTMGMFQQKLGTDGPPFSHLDAVGKVADRVWADYDLGFVKEIDAFDNGVGKPQKGHVSNLIESLAPQGPFSSGKEASDALDRAFLEAVDMMTKFLIADIRGSISSWIGVTEFERSAEFIENGSIAVMPEGMPWKRAVTELGLDDLLYVVFPKEDGSIWFCTAVPDAPGSFGQRRPLPLAWAGVRDADLGGVCGVLDAEFCHPARFICGARSKTGAIAMAKLAAA